MSDEGEEGDDDRNSDHRHPCDLDAYSWAEVFTSCQKIANKI